MSATTIICTKIATCTFRVVLQHEGQVRTTILGVIPSACIQPPAAERVLRDFATRPERWTALNPARA